MAILCKIMTDSQRKKYRAERKAAVGRVLMKFYDDEIQEICEKMVRSYGLLEFLLGRQIFASDRYITLQEAFLRLTKGENLNFMSATAVEILGEIYLENTAVLGHITDDYNELQRVIGFRTNITTGNF